MINAVVVVARMVFGGDEVDGVAVVGGVADIGPAGAADFCVGVGIRFPEERVAAIGPSRAVIIRDAVVGVEVNAAVEIVKAVVFAAEAIYVGIGVASAHVERLLGLPLGRVVAAHRHSPALKGCGVMLAVDGEESTIAAN